MCLEGDSEDIRTEEEKVHEGAVWGIGIHSLYRMEKDGDRKMCELFGVSAEKRRNLNELLRVFFSHGVDHPNGWGMAFFYGNAVSLEKEPETSCKSLYLKERMRGSIEADNMIAHIRQATRGVMAYTNTHPFVLRDNCDRAWTLAHNGTIFACEQLDSFVHVQQGQTDSERILLYLVSRVNEEQERLGRPLSRDERFRLVDELICEITPENKVDLLLYDGELLFAHVNYSLRVKSSRQIKRSA